VEVIVKEVVSIYKGYSKLTIFEMLSVYELTLLLVGISTICI